MRIDARMWGKGSSHVREHEAHEVRAARRVQGILSNACDGGVGVCASGTRVVESPEPRTGAGETGRGVGASARDAYPAWWS